MLMGMLLVERLPTIMIRQRGTKQERNLFQIYKEVLTRTLDIKILTFHYYLTLVLALTFLIQTIVV